MRRLFARVSIRIKIVAAFALVLCCTAGLGVFAVHRLAAVNAAAADVRENWLPGTQVLGRMSQIAERLRLDQYIVATTQSAERRRTIDEQTIELAARFDAAQAAYLPLVSGGEEEALAKAVVASWSSYKAFSASLTHPIQRAKVHSAS